MQCLVHRAPLEGGPRNYSKDEKAHLCAVACCMGQPTLNLEKKIIIETAGCFLAWFPHPMGF